MTVYKIPDMTCGHCEKVVKETVLGLDGAAKIDVDLTEHTAKISALAGTDVLLAALKDAGYEATLA